MQSSKQLAKHIRELHFGGNWTTASLKLHLETITWQQATKKIQSFNTIAELTYHINYYSIAVLNVLQGKALTAKDKFSFKHPTIRNQNDWTTLLDKTWKDAEALATSIELLPESRLNEDFVDEKYGNYYRNLLGVIEHSHYHLGQIVILKQLLQQKK